MRDKKKKKIKYNTITHAHTTANITNTPIHHHTDTTPHKYNHEEDNFNYEQAN